MAASRYGAAQVVDPRPFSVGEMAATLAKYPHIGKVVPAMGYSPAQVRPCPRVHVQLGLLQQGRTGVSEAARPTAALRRTCAAPFPACML